MAVAFSLGGFVALEMLRSAPDRLSGVVLMASNALPIQSDPADRRSEIALFENCGGRTVVAKHWDKYVAPRRRGDQELKQVIDQMAEDTDLPAFAAQTELAISRPDSRNTLATTAVPVLIVDGALDAMAPVGRNRDLVLSPSVTRVEIPDCGHFVPLEAPERASAAMTRFLARSAACCSA